MADGILINTGTGPTVAAEMIGTALHQKVKLVVGASGTDAALAFGQSAMAASFPVVIATDQSTISVNVVAFTPVISATGVTIASITTGTISGSVSVINTPTVTVSTMPVISATGVTIASITTGTISGSVSVINTPTVTVSALPNVVITSITAGTVSISNTPTVTVSTMPVISATGVTIASITTGTISGSISVINTPTVTVSTMPVISATGVTIASITTGTVSVSTVLAMPVLSATGVTIAQITTGTVSINNTPTVTVTALPPGYSIGTTGMVATGTGFLVIGIQSGGTTGRGLALTTSGQAMVQIATGTVNVVNVISATGVTVASITTGTISGTVSAIILTPPSYSHGGASIAATGTGFLCIGVQSGSTVSRGIALTVTGHQYAQISTGSCDVRPITSTVMIGGMFATHHASGWSAYTICTTSGVATVLKASGAHTLYVTDLMFAANVGQNVKWFSNTTTRGEVFFTSNAGMALALASPMILNSAQGLNFTISVSGSCAAFAAGWTVT